MTKAQIELLKRLIEAERFYWRQMVEYHKTSQTTDYPHSSYKAVEVGKITGVDPRTAKSLVEAGLCDSVSTNEWGGWQVWLDDFRDEKDDANT